MMHITRPTVGYLPKLSEDVREVHIRLASAADAAGLADLAARHFRQTYERDVGLT